MIDLIGWTLIHSLWQGGAIAVGLALLLWCARRAAPSVRHAFSLVALGLMVILPLVTALRLHGTSPGARRIASPASIAPSTDQTSVARMSPQGAIPSTDRVVRRGAVSPAHAPGIPEVGPASGDSRVAAGARWATLPGLVVRGIDVALPWIVAAWLVGLMLLSIRLIGGLGRVTRLSRDGTTPTSDYIRRTMHALAQRLGIRVAVRVFESARAQVPMVIGWMQPVILLPASALTGLTPRQLEMLLAHELAHIRRHDFAVNLAQTVIETLLFFHPATWWISDRVREERENCCDDMALAVCDGDRATYTAALVALEEGRGEAPGLVAAATGGPLLRRVLRLIRGESAHVDLGPRWFAGVITVLTALLTAGQTVQLAAAPMVSASINQSPDTPKTRSSRSDARAEWRDTTRARPDTVLRSPAGGTLAERWRWAEERSRAARFRTFWIGYVVEGDTLGASWYFFDRHVPVLSGDGTMTGRMRFGGGDAGGLIFPGVRLAPLVGNHAPNDKALFFGFESDGRGTPRLVRIHLGSFALPMFFDRLPLIWLDAAADAESIDRIQTLMARSTTRELREDLVAMTGTHHDSRLVVPALERWLDGRGEATGIRKEAAEWLGVHPLPQALATLARVARADRERDVRKEAIEALGHMQLGPACDTLIALARTLEERDLRREALESIGHRSEPRAIEYLVAFVNGAEDRELRAQAVEALGNVPDGRGVDAVIAFAQRHADPEIRRVATEQISNFEPASRSLDLLSDIVRRDVDERVRSEAVEAIADVHDPRSVAVLRDVIAREPDGGVLMEAVEALANTVAPAEAITELARLARSHPRSEVQRKAVESLGDLESEVAVARLLELAQSHPDVDVQIEAAEALGSVHPHEPALAALRRLTRDHARPEVRRQAIESLGSFSDEPRALEALVELATQGDDVEVRSEAIETLGEHDNPAARRTLASIANSQAPDRVRLKAMESYAQGADSRTAVAFLTALARSDPSETIRRHALEALSELDDDAGVPALRGFARSTTDERLRKLAVELLSER